jgi:hypothetical protein
MFTVLILPSAESMIVPVKVEKMNASGRIVQS